MSLFCAVADFAGAPSKARLFRKSRLGRRSYAVVLLLALGGCGALRPSTTPQPTFYALDDNGRPQPRATTVLPASVAAPTLIVNPPHAASGFDSQRIIYVRSDHQLEYFAHSEWVDTPARMLAPLIVGAVEASGVFRAVVPTPSAAAGDIRLDSEIVRLQHEFDSTPSRVRFTLRAYLVDNSTRRVIAWREFDETVPTASENPYGGVVAANRAVQNVLQQLADFCAESARERQTRHN